MKTINLWGSQPSCLPRMLWQGLFDYYQESGDLSNMDNMLIDYDLCKKVFERLHKSGESERVECFLWGFTDDMTNLNEGSVESIREYATWQLDDVTVIVTVNRTDEIFEATFEVLNNA